MAVNMINLKHDSYPHSLWPKDQTSSCEHNWKIMQEGVRRALCLGKS